MTLLDNAKDLARLVQQLDNVEITQKVIDLQRDALEMQEELFRVKEELRKSRDAEERDSKLVIRGGMYRLDDPYIHESRRGPFCTKCKDVDEKLVALKGSQKQGFWCPHCKTQFSTPESAASMRKAFKLSDDNLGEGW